MAKIRMQWKPPVTRGEKPPVAAQYTSSLDILRKVYAQEGLNGWYKVQRVRFCSGNRRQGMGTQIAKAVFCQAILFVSKEKMTLFTQLLLQNLIQEVVTVPVAK